MIQLLPDSVANQIAAGEVVQRPASVVKELVENAVDAGSTHITIVIKDAGRTLLQIIDNGCGMSDVDARLSFERHATSKIKTADDLHHLSTFGFRGEALASVASIAEVELKTRRPDDEMGTYVQINASKVISQQAVSCPVGSNFIIKNLFFNVPARRKFLKSDAVELKHIVNELQRVAICNPHIAFILVSNGTEIYNLPKGNLRQRIIALFGKSINNTLIDVNVNTSIVNISGFIGKAEAARKTMGEQFFFVNNRYFRSAYLQKAVWKAYEQLLPANVYPSFFIFLDLDPSKIDVNIHPTKTEIKFEDEQAIWQMMNAGVRESLSKFAVAPAIIFDTEGAVDIPILRNDTLISEPTVEIDTTYNPFEQEGKQIATRSSKQSGKIRGWEQLYAGMGRNTNNSVENFERNEQGEDITPEQQTFESSEVKLPVENRFLQLKGKYILTSVKSGLMVIDQVRAHQRILYEKFMLKLETYTTASQCELYPQTIELNPSDYLLLEGITDDLAILGFDIRRFGTNSVVVYALPIEIKQANISDVINGLLNTIKNNHESLNDNLRQRLAVTLAMGDAINPKRVLSEREMQHLVDSLFACTQPDICPNGKPTLTIIDEDELDKKLFKY